MTNPLDLEAVVLVGGRGTRLRGLVSDRPKPMVEVAGRPFVEWLLMALRLQGVRRVVLCTGHLGELVEAHFGDGARLGLDIAYEREEDLLGTAGAVRAALDAVRGQRLLALNGDSYCRFDLARLLHDHESNSAQATLWLTPVADGGRYGTVELDGAGRVTAFREKAAAVGPGLISAGVYLLERSCVERLSFGRKVSIETEFFPALVGDGLYGVAGDGIFLDIGTPESYRAAGQTLAEEFRSMADRIRREGHLQRAEAHLRAAADLHRTVAASDLGLLLDAAEMIAGAFRAGRKVLLCGNGGSAADCQHVAAEFVSRLTKDFERPALPAIALTTDTSFLTAYANDCGFDGIFERQVEALAAPGDVLIGISTSGGSANVVRAVQAAHARGVSTIGLLGQGGSLSGLVQCAVEVPSRDTQNVQEVLLTVEHILCDLVEQAMFGEAEA